MTAPQLLLPRSCFAMAEVMSAEEILQRLQSRKRIFDYPRAGERGFWESLSADTREELIRSGEQELETPTAFLSAKDYMKFVRNGNRIDYERPFFRRRHALTGLVLAECAEYKGRFLDDIADALWQILSEPVWCLPAHQRLTEYALPGPEEWVVDLFAAETAKVLTDVLQLLRPELEKEYLPLVKRICYEVEHRVLAVCEKESFWWYEGTNNWSVWCCYSVNSAAIEVWQDDLPRLSAFLAGHIVPMKNFYDRYPADGGCNEGPSYWLVAVGMLMNGLNVLQRRLGGFDNWLAEGKLKNMINFIPRMNLCGGWFMGFSDAESFFARVPRGLFLTYAAMVGSEEMAALALSLPDFPLEKAALGNRDCGNIYEVIANLTSDLSETKTVSHNAVDFWPDLQIWIARQYPGNPEKGMVCTLKGGHNKQSHNHMDLGHFSLWHKNAPVIIDVGRGIYSKTCFSQYRYTLWNLSNKGHNAGCFNRALQGIGIEFTGTLVKGENSVECDLSRAFEAEAGIRKYLRQVAAQWENKKILISESAAFEGTKNIEVSFYTPVEPGVIKDNTLMLGDVELSCTGIELAEVVKVDWADSKISDVWGDLWEIRLRVKAENSASWTIGFSEK